MAYWEDPPGRRNIRLPRRAYRSGDAFLVTIGAVGRIAIFDDPRIAGVVVRHLDSALRTRGGPVDACCLMPNHLHLLLAAVPDVVTWVGRFKAATTTAARRAGIRSSLWQRSFHDRCLPRRHGFVEAAARYIIDNPVRAGLATRWDEWPYTRVVLGRRGGVTNDPDRSELATRPTPGR